MCPRSIQYPRGFPLSLRLVDAATSHGGDKSRWSATTAIAAVLAIAGASFAAGLALSLARAASLIGAGAADTGSALGGVFIEMFSILLVVGGAATLTLRTAIGEPLARLLDSFEAGVPPRRDFRLEEAANLSAAVLSHVSKAADEGREAAAALARDYEARLIAIRALPRSETPFAVLEALGAAARGDLTLRLSSETCGEPAAERYDQAVALMAKTLAAFSASLEAMRAAGARAEAILGRHADEIAEHAASADVALRALAEAAARDSAWAGPVAEAARSLHSVGETALAHAGVVESAASSFSAISSAGREIAATSALIDEVAFQTSLLALNAGIEFGSIRRGGSRHRGGRTGIASPFAARHAGGEGVGRTGAEVG